MQFRLSYLLGLNELVGLAYVQNLGLLMKRAPAFFHSGTDHLLCNKSLSHLTIKIYPELYSCDTIETVSLLQCFLHFIWVFVACNKECMLTDSKVLKTFYSKILCINDQRSWGHFCLFYLKSTWIAEWVNDRALSYT